MTQKCSILLAWLLISFQSYCQLKISDFDKLPLGIDFSERSKIKSYFQVKPRLMEGDTKGIYRIDYENISFDKYGTANYSFHFVNGILSHVDIELLFKSNELNQFETLLKSLRNDLFADKTKEFLKQYSSFKMLDAINYARKECKGEEGESAREKYNDINTKFLGYDVWNIKSSLINDGRFFFVETSLHEVDDYWKDLQNKQHEYHGGRMYVTISLTNNRLQELRNWEKDLTSNARHGFEEPKKEIRLKESDGVYKVAATINNMLTMDFVVDLGASDVSLSPDVFSVLYKAGKIEQDDFVGSQLYKLADGSTVKSNIINLKSLVIGDINLENVRASISNSLDAPLLLGQSALKKLGTYSIDNAKKLLIVE